MRFLTRLLKTPEEDQNEEQDEFDAEENGLLIVNSLPRDAEGATPAGTPEADAPQASVPAVGREMADPPSQGDVRPAEDEAGQLLTGEDKSPGQTEKSPPPQSQAPESVGEEPQTEEGSSDDPMHMFRASAKRTFMAPVLKDDLEDLPAVDLLAVARSIRNDLLGRQAVAVEKPQKQERAA